MMCVLVIKKNLIQIKSLFWKMKWALAKCICLAPKLNEENLVFLKKKKTKKKFRFFSSPKSEKKLAETWPDKSVFWPK